MRDPIGASYKPPAPIVFAVRPHERGGFVIRGECEHALRHKRWPTARDCVWHIKGEV